MICQAMETSGEITRHLGRAASKVLELSKTCDIRVHSCLHALIFASSKIITNIRQTFPVCSCILHIVNWELSAEKNKAPLTSS